MRIQNGAHKKAKLMIVPTNETSNFDSDGTKLREGIVTLARIVFNYLVGKIYFQNVVYLRISPEVMEGFYISKRHYIKHQNTQLFSNSTNLVSPHITKILKAEFRRSPIFSLNKSNNFIEFVN